MPGAVLHVYGRDLDPEAALASLQLQAYRVYRKGEPLLAGSRINKLHDSSGFCCEVSASDGVLAEEVADATKFMTRHFADLAVVRENPSVEGMCIDFGYYLRIYGENFITQIERLPSELLRLAGELRIGFELSPYLRSENK